jgi:CBS domain-containing protein
MPASKLIITLNLNQLRNLPVAELLSPVKALDAETPMSKVIGYLKQNNLYEAFFDEKDRTGIATLRSILAVKNIVNTKLSTIMAFIPRLAPRNTVGEAAALMFEYRIRSLAIFEGGKIKGQITARAIIEKLMEAQPTTRADRFMTPDPICVDSSDEVAKARSIMIRRKVDQLPVTKEGKLDSVITSSSIVFNMIPQTERNSRADAKGGRFDVPVENFASPDIVQNDASDRAKEVFDNMTKNDETYSVITNFDEIQGIITHRDFMKMIMNARDSSEPQMYIVGLPEDPFEAEATREKFTRVIRLVRKALPDVLEARAIIKAGETKAARKRYQVQVFITTPRQRYNYQASGFELPDVFDEISSWSRKLAEHDERPRRRVRGDPGSLA